jgi:type IV secretion system protein VirB10
MGVMGMESPKPDTVDADKDPGSLKHGDAPSGVRRVNNMPLLIIGGVLTVFVLLVAMVAAQRGASNRKPATSTTGPALPENSQFLDQMMARGPVAGLVPDPDEASISSFPVARPADLDAPPRPGQDVSGPLSADGASSDAVAKERMKWFQTAMHAKTGVTRAPDHEASSQGAKNGDDGPEDAMALDHAADKRIPVAADGDYSKFDRSHGRGAKKVDRWLLDSSVEAPRTAYEVRAGSVIPATMISGIHSELPGQITAQVSQDVFDTPTGRHRLIPQGAKLVGSYSHNVVMGQSRVLVAWQRIVFPDGKALDIGSMGGVDSGGYAGFQDQIDRHYARLFGSAILMSAIAAGLTSSRVSPENDPYGSSNAATLSQNTAQQIGDVASKMIEKNMDIAPTLKIRPGYRFNVTAVKDLTFDKPYQPFDY